MQLWWSWSHPSVVFALKGCSEPPAEAGSNQRLQLCQVEAELAPAEAAWAAADSNIQFLDWLELVLQW